MTLREFEDIDWKCWSGAEESEDGRVPLIRAESLWLGVISKNGFEIEIAQPKEHSRVYVFICTYDLAKLIVESLPKDLTIEMCKKLGFKRIIG